MARFLKLSPFWYLLLAGAVLRLIFVPFGDNPDLYSLSGWAKWIYENGTRGFYENNQWVYAWPTQFPGFNLLMWFAYFGYEQTLNIMRWLTFNVVPYLAPGHMRWWFEWVKWWDVALFSPSNFKYGMVIWVKILPILADLVIASLMYFIGKGKVGAKIALLVSAVYLFMPFTWYLSALWGQYDQLVALCLLLSFIGLFKKRFLLSTTLLFIGIQIKPTLSLLIPLFVFYYFLQKPKIKDIVLSIILGFILFYLVLIPFSSGNPFSYFLQVIWPKAFNADRFVLATHVFNFWQMLWPQKVSSSTLLLLVPSYLWSLVILIIVNLLSFKTIIKIKGSRGLFTALYIVYTGTYLFGIGMLDRYFFPATILLGILCFYNQKLIKWWILTCAIFSLNLWYSWGYPIIPIDKVWQNDIFIRLMSFGQVALFFVCLYKLKLFKIKYKEVIKGGVVLNEQNIGSN